MNIDALFLLMENIRLGNPTKPAPLWLYLEDEKGQPCPIGKLNAYIVRYNETGGKDIVFYTCRRVPKHRKKYVINFRDFLSHISKTPLMAEATLKFATHLILDTQMASNDSGFVNQVLLTKITMKLNELLTHQEGTLPKF